MLINLLNLCFTAYFLLLLARIIGSWFLSMSSHPIWLFICKFTEPYLALFRRLIPPIGGRFDISPIVAFFVLRIIQSFLFSLFR